MPYLNIAREVFHDAVMGGTDFARFNNANSHIAVGDSDDGFDRTHTNLQGSNTARLPMEAGYPERDGITLRFRSVADGSTANHAWNEWGVANAAAAGQMLNRRVQALGTKGEGTTWTITAEITNVLPDPE